MMYLKAYETVPIYEARFQESLAQLKNLSEGNTTRDQYRYDEIRRPPQA